MRVVERKRSLQDTCVTRLVTFSLNLLIVKTRISPPPLLSPPPVSTREHTRRNQSKPNTRHDLSGRRNDDIKRTRFALNKTKRCASKRCAVESRQAGGFCVPVPPPPVITHIVRDPLSRVGVKRGRERRKEGRKKGEDRGVDARKGKGSMRRERDTRREGKRKAGGVN